MINSNNIGEMLLLRKSFYVIVPLLSTILTLLGIEAGFAIFCPVPYSIEINMYFEPDAFTGYKLKPNGVGYFQNGIVAKTNSHGHRDDEVSLLHPPDVLRILVLGDSLTVGAGVAQEDAYPQVLEKLLNQDLLQFSW